MISLVRRMAKRRETQEMWTADPAMRWGLGDVFVGLMVALLFAVVTQAILLKALGYKSDAKTADLKLWLVAVLQIPLWLGLVGAPVMSTIQRGTRSLRRDFRWAFKPIDIVWGVAGGLALQGLVYLVYQVISVDECSLSGPARNLTDKANGIVGVPLLVLITVIGAPVVEELFFRGLLLRSLCKRRLPMAASIVVSALIFAGFHFQGAQFAGLAVVGIVLASLALWTDRLGPGIVAHAVFNLVSVITLLRSNSCK